MATRLTVGTTLPLLLCLKRSKLFRKKKGETEWISIWSATHSTRGCAPYISFIPGKVCFRSLLGWFFCQQDGEHSGERLKGCIFPCYLSYGIRQNGYRGGNLISWCSNRNTQLDVVHYTRRLAYIERTILRRAIAIFPDQVLYIQVYIPVLVVWSPLDRSFSLRFALGPLFWRSWHASIFTTGK